MILLILLLVDGKLARRRCLRRTDSPSTICFDNLNEIDDHSAPICSSPPALWEPCGQACGRQAVHWRSGGLADYNSGSANLSDVQANDGAYHCSPARSPGEKDVPSSFRSKLIARNQHRLSLLGAVWLFVIALFVAVLVCGLLIAKRASDDFGTMIAGGLTCMLVGQAFLNMACATGLFPTTGKPLPFISSGGSSVVASLLMVGIIMSVSRVAGEEALTPHRASAERRRANLSYIRVEDEPPARSRFSSSESAPVVDAPTRSRHSHGDPFGGLMAPRGGASRNASRGSSRPEGNASLGSRASRRHDSGMERGANRRGSGRNSR